MESLFKEIETYETIILHRHVRPDPDALGSQAGLAFLIKDNYPDKQVFMVGEEVPSLEFIAKMDEIPDTTYEGALVIVCDTANQERISDQRYKMGAKLLKIDHHPNVEAYGDWMWVDTKASSVSEMIASLYKGHPRLELTARAARVLYTGIVGDTGRFLYNNTRPQTHLLTAKLLEKEIHPQAIHDQMEVKPETLIRFQGYVLQNFDFLEGGVGQMRLSIDLLNSWGLSSQQASSLINCISELEGLKSWVFFIEESDQIRVRLRSKGPVINELAARYNGGGHPLASGATVFSWEECDQLLKELQEICLRA